MPNDYFEFKQFTVQQAKAAMKVCTDACLFGAWVASELNNGIPVRRVLDIGTGTGLLSLMLAQQSSASITAVEIDRNAAEQAADNFNASPWKERLHVVNSDIRSFRSDESFDLVISNPPFFENDLKSADQRRNLALHSGQLNFVDLVNAATTLSAEQAYMALLLPYRRHLQCVELAQKEGWHLLRNISVHQTEKHGAFRSMLWFSKMPGTLSAASIDIRQGLEYSGAFVELLREYYKLIS